MGKRNRWRDHIDPEYQRWGRTYPKFPGVAECARLVKRPQTRGAWMDIIVFELAENASVCLPELIETFKTDPSMCFVVLAALEIAHLPASTAFFLEVLREGNPRYEPFALRALEAIDTPESRKALWEASLHKKPDPLIDG